MRNSIPIICLLIFLLAGCEQESTVPVQTITGNQGSTKELIIEVYELTDPVLNTLEPLSDVDIRLFDSEENFITEMNEVKIMSTDSSGKACFKSMQSGYYYIIAVHPAWGRIEDAANLPGSSVRSYLELIYF